MPKHTNEETQKLVSRKWVAERHGCSTETIKRKERAGLLPALKLGRLVRYRIEDVLKYEEGARI